MKRRVLHAAAFLGAALSFVLAVVLGFAIHLDLPCARRLALAEVQAALGPVLEGRIELQGLERLRLTGIDGLRAVVVDPEGIKVLELQGVSARVSLLHALRTLILGTGDVDVLLSCVHVDRADVSLDLAADGAPRLAHAFTPRVPVQPALSTGASSGGPGRAVRVALSEVTIRHAWVHGPVPGGVLVDADASELRGSLLVSSGGVAIDVPEVHFAARRLPRAETSEGKVEVHIAVPSSADQDIAVAVVFEGAIGAIPLHGHGKLEGSRLDAGVEIAELDLARVRATFPGVPLYGNASARITVHGELPRLDAAADVTLAAGTLKATGNIMLVDPWTGSLEVDAASLDVRSFAPGAPPSDLGAKLKARFTVQADLSLAADVHAEIPPGTLGGQVVPAASLEAAVAIPREGPSKATVRARGSIAEEGAPTAVAFDVHPARVSSNVDFDVTSRVPRLDALSRVKGLPSGHGHVESRGTVNLESGAIVATVTAELGDIAKGATRIGSLDVGARITGTVQSPDLATTVRAAVIDVGPFHFAHADGKSVGPLLSPRVELGMAGTSGPDLVVSGAIEGAGGAFTVRAIDLEARRSGVVLRATVDRLRLMADEAHIDGIDAEGLGEPLRGAVAVTPGALHVLATSTDLDLDRLGRLLGVERRITRGHASLDVELDARRDSATGKLTVDLAHGSFEGLDDVNGRASLVMTGRGITGSARGSLGNVGWVDVKPSRVELGPGGPLRLRAWQAAWGEVDMNGTVDLARLAKLLPKNALPLEEIAGEVYFEAHGARESGADFTPELALSARTHGLLVAGKARGVLRRFAGIDLQLDASINGISGFAELAARVADKDGVLAALDAKSAALPFAQLFEVGGPVVDQLERAPFSAMLVMLRRPFDRLPVTLPMLDPSGEAEATLEMTGSVRAPNLTATAKGYRLKVADAPESAALFGDVVAHYDGTAADISMKMRSQKEEVFAGHAEVTAPVDALLDRGAALWALSTDMRLTRFPLAAMPAFEDRGARGHVSGSLSLLDWHRDARAKVSLRIDDLEIGAATYRGGQVDGSIDDRALSVTAKVAQTAGSLDATAKIGVKWGEAILPAFDASQPVTASLDARSFSAAALLPFASGTFSELDGLLDGAASLSLDEGRQVATVKGGLSLDKGLVQLASTGQEFHKVHAKLTLQPDGVLRLEDVTAYGLSGKLMASAVGRLRGLHLGEARASIRIAKNQPIPLDVGGTEIGEVDGDLDVVATSPAPRVTRVEMQIPILHVQLASGKAHDVEALDPPEHLRAGVYQAGRPVELPLSADDVDETAAASTGPPSELDVAVHLGQDVTIRRGANLKVTLDGDPAIIMKGGTRVSGQIRLKSGTLEVQGKRFQIDSGTLTFVGDDAQNPEVVVTAEWSAPDGTRVFADFVGPLKTGKVRLRSEPTLPENEIVALIMFGTTNGGQSTPGANTQNTTASAGAAASGFATEGLSQGIDELTGLDVTTRIDTSDPATPRPEVELQIARDISLQIAFVLGTPAPGQNPDKTFATVGWRFIKNWSLETTFGDQGSSIADVLWQYRY